ncbi:MAG: hypothetical protein Q8M09_06160 [Pseudomonadota bacterium]|nr:hypothetical protein [Pseudomonadota bacterium]MDP1903813.1 hypothetical protein [Pseudomonadota bacterium]MDP2353754.1 hypothetical protein [Pseudomonadota bacterium]
MAKGLRYQNDYLIGGPARVWVTPNFKLSEYAGSDGRMRVHRELVNSVQMLRDALGTPLGIAGMAAADGLGQGLEGRFVWLGAADTSTLEAKARQLMKAGDFIRVEPRGARLYVEMPDPEHLPALDAERALDRAIAVTAGFETSGDPYLQVTGNFDGAGLSFGPLQVNFKTGTLQEMFRRFLARDEARLIACFGPLWPEWQRVLRLPSRVKQVAWADDLSRGPRKADFAPQWKAALQTVGAEPAFRAEMLRYAYDTYGRKLVVALSWLRGLLPLRIGNFRCLAALYDLCVQQGSLDRAHDAIRRRVQREQPVDEFHLTRIAVEERGRKANSQWRADCISRRLCILEREPVKIAEAGQTAERDNPNLYLLRNAPVNQIEKYLL